MGVKHLKVLGILSGTISAIIAPTFSMACISDNILAKTNISEVQTYFSSEVREQIYQEVQSNEILRDYILNNKIIQITTAGKVTDNSFNQMTWEAISEFSRNVGFNLDMSSYKETKSMSTNEIHQAYSDALNKQYKIWVLTGWQHSSFFQSWIQIPVYRQKFKEQNIKIISIDWDATQISELDPGTCISLNFRTQESSFLIGYAISQYLNEKYPDDETKKIINTTAGTDTAGSTNFSYGFLEGIRAWNNEQTDETKKIFSNVYKADSKVFLETTYEPNNPLTRNEFTLSITGQGKEIFKEQAPTIVMPVAADWSNTAANIIKETNKLDQQWVVGVDSNMAISYGPTYAPYFITSAEKRIGIATYKALCFLLGISQTLSLPELYPNSNETNWIINLESTKIEQNSVESNMVVNGGIELGFVGASPSTLSNKEDAKRFDAIIKETKNKFFGENSSENLLKTVDQTLLAKYNEAKLSNNIAEYNLAVFNLANVLYGEMNANNKEYFNLVVSEINRRGN